jgi:uncharacterized protein YegL
MARANHDEIVLVVDRSGFTVVYFNDTYEVIHDGADINSVMFNHENYVPGGFTALLDAIGKAIDTVGERLSNTPEEQRPEKVIVAVMTDGLENASKEYTKEQVKEKIKHQSEAYGWIFEFLGANIDVIAEAADLGISKTQTVVFDTTPAGMRNLGEQMTSRIATYRTAR